MNYFQSCLVAFGISSVTSVVSEHHPLTVEDSIVWCFPLQGFMRHKTLLEHLFPGSWLSRDSDGRDCKTIYPTVEKPEVFCVLLPHHHLLCSLGLSGRAIVLCLSNPENINTSKSPRTATTEAFHRFPFYSNPTASSKALFNSSPVV